jgi:predicted DNA-binding protein (UPF0251 family)
MSKRLAPLRNKRNKRKKVGLPLDEAAAVSLYRAGWSLREIGRRHGVSHMTVQRRLGTAVVRRLTQQRNVETWPRVALTCPICVTDFDKRQKYWKRRRTHVCSRTCWDWEERRIALEQAANTVVIEISYSSR